MTVSMHAVGEPRAGALRCALVGDEPLVAQCVDVALEHGLVVVLVATTNQIVRQHAVEQGIAVVGPGAEVAAGLDAHPADVLLSIANLRLLPDDVLARVRTAVNFHDGPLPAYAGLNVTTWALLAGEPEHAITWHLMTTDVDAGEVVMTERFPVADDETAFSLNARCYEAALETFPRVAAALADGSLTTTPQGHGEQRMFRRHDRPAHLLDPARPAADTVRAVRALDLGHRLRNSVGVVRLMVGGEVLVVDAAHVVDATGAPAGTVVGFDDGGVRIATSDADLVVTAASTPSGSPADVAAVFAAAGADVGSILPSPSPQLVADLAELEPVLARDEAWWLERVAGNAPTASTFAGPVSAPFEVEHIALDVADEVVLAGVGLWLARVSAAETVTVALAVADHDDVIDRLGALVRRPVAVLDVATDRSFGELTALAADELSMLRRREPLLSDAIGREPATRGSDTAPAVLVELGAGDDWRPSTHAALHVASGSGRLRLAARRDPDDPGALGRAARQLATVIRGGHAEPSTPAGDVDLLDADDLAALDALNHTDLDHDRTTTVDALFHARAAADPEAPAVSFGPTTLTYRALEEAVTAFAGRLADAGVGRGDRVGIAVPRGLDMLVGVLATLDLGAAYLPLDPTYPVERLQLMVDDAGIAALVATGATIDELRRDHVAVIDPTEPAAGAHEHHPAASAAARPDDLAYVIYTSGSTGTPKGVMLEHRQVVNFFDAMDQVIDVEPAGVWLAVTSLSFDISVLELLWTLTRGFHVVLKSDRGVPDASQTDGHGAIGASGDAVRPVSFSLFYFAAGEDAAADGYRLLLDSARFADRHGFEAVWTPERHFHAFGGAYPNPSVAGAALAAITTNVGIRAGSVVLPLHSPVRVAEEWAVVDNLSRGRVAISFAAGWQPDDFVLNPSAYATAKTDLPERIDLVQRLWRGETVALPGHDGSPVDVRTLPRPVQPDLPVWLTSAGSPATFERAGTLGANVLTHLLGQSVEQLTENIDRYRAAWRAAGHAGDGRVTLMMHTYLDRDADVARETAREPMKSYLGTAVGLLRDVASAFPTFAGRGSGTDDLFKSLTPDEMDQLLEVAAQRYLGTSGLFGTPDDAAEIVERVSAAGVDEVACLIDFGVATDDALASLDLLLEAKSTVDANRVDTDIAQHAAPPVLDPLDDTVAALVGRHGVTHLQCTPSLAAMLVADPADRDALGRVRHLLLGGEALPSALAAELRALLPARFTNMYGPTETTIWSLTHELDADPGPAVPIGTPIANTTIFVLDAAGRRLPIGTFGELHIGGEGVARGYHDREALTAERFVERDGIGRVYATGDVVRIHPDGFVEFGGRADNQVKIRGHRIELGEIEAVLDRHPDVVQAVVVACDDRGDTRLVGYVVMHHGADATSDALRKHVGEVLPDAMVPSVVVRVDAFPLTPNGKIDRKALPADTGIVSGDAQRSVAPPADDTEQLVADIWAAELDRTVGRDDNFFDIGGHSLLAVKVFRRLSDATAAPLALTDIFRFPTVRTFGAHLAALTGGDSAAPAAPVVAAPTGADRGAMRRRVLARRGGGPA